MSFAAAIAYGMFVALRTYEVDLGVYLRLGGSYIFTPHLYSLALPNTSLLFTYPPFAALLFAPWERMFTGVNSVQMAWTLCNLAALIGVLLVSLRVLEARSQPKHSLASCPGADPSCMLLNPVLVTVGFGQVNLVVTLLVMWDLLTQRRIGTQARASRHRHGTCRCGQADTPALRSLSAPDAPLPRSRHCLLTFLACELVTYPRFACLVEGLLDEGPVQAGPRRSTCPSSAIRTSGPTGALRPRPFLVLPSWYPSSSPSRPADLWLATLAHRRSSPMLGVLICAAICLLVSPISWAHHMVWVVPAILWLALADDRPRRGRIMAACAAVLFWSAPIWWVPYKNTSDLQLNACQLIAGNSFFVATVIFLCGATVLIARQRSNTLDYGVKLG